MKKLIAKYNPFGHKVFRKGFWLFEKQKLNIEKSAEKNWDGNESALIRHIIDCWFNK